MIHYVALLRAVNVGGKGKIKMSALRETAEELGLENPRTYIASGNLVFQSKLKENSLKKKLENELKSRFDLTTQILIRSHTELTAIIEANPFKKTNPSHTLITFLDKQPPADTMKKLKNLKNEEIELGVREIYVHYPDGISNSKLLISASKNGTARNLNTTRKLTDLAQ